MTHDGPYSSSTTQDKTSKIDEGDILFGSKHLYSLLKNDGGKKIFANIHGHAHDGSPGDKITHGVRVINPGSLKYGEYAELVLVKSQ
jgi:Icc-related predicted phosphoesterase